MNKFCLTVLLALALVFAGSNLYAVDPSLHPFFAQNGDCYILIGDGPHRGVYALNNLTSGVNEWLYDPYEAYGLVAAQSYDGSIHKWLYTFASTETGWQNLTGKVARRVITNATNKEYRTSIPPYIVHRYHGSPFNSPTGHGNHSQHTLNWKFDGFDYPCSEVPDPVSGKPGYYWVEMGKFYHSMDRPVKSPFTYGCYYSPGYWVHWVVRENGKVKYRNLKLYEYDVTNGVGPTEKPGSTLPPVKIEEKLTLDKRGECVDGCLKESDGEVLPGGMTPYLDTAYASSIDRSYLYSREPNKTTYTLYGYVAGKDILIGNPSDLSTKFIGVSSSKFNDASYVYALGKSVINQWMLDAAAPAGMLINEIEDLAVSDQWWLTGGIVYVYDKTKRKVYKFVRNEGSAAGLPEEISVDDDGIAPDSIGADGFGHLYMVKTNFEPKNASDFEPKDAYHIDPNTMWPNRYRAYFKQDVYKSVFKRDYYTKAIVKVPGGVLLGSNKFYRDFYTTDVADLDSWVWLTSFVQFGPVVDTEYRTELAVINSATPPEVTNTDAVCDVAGPLKIVGTSLIYEDLDEYNEDEYYVFEVENSPDFDVNGVNTGNLGEDVDGDTRIGRFPSTTHEDSLRYYWKIIQLKDRHGNEVNNEILNQEKNGTLGDYRLVRSFPGGEYRVGVKVRYKYYDYSRLDPGDMADKKDTVLTGMYTAAAEDGDGYSWCEFTVKYYPPPPDPQGEGVIMSGKPITASNYNYRPSESDAQYWAGWTDAVPPATKHPKFVIKADSTNWAFKIRDCLTNINNGIDRVDQMKQAIPPHPNPGDPKIIPGSIKWISEEPSYSWTADITWINGEGMNVRIETEEDFITTGQIKKLFRVPSQPRSYTFTVKGSRAYEYKQYIYDFAKDEWVDISIPKVVKIDAQAEVIVTDETGPALSFDNPYHDSASPKPGVPATNKAFFCSERVLYGTTGETLENTAGKSNPSEIVFVVADNNPNAFATKSSYTDPFHTANKMNHNTDLLFARFGYYNTSGLVPIGDGTLSPPHLSWYHYKSKPYTGKTPLDEANCKLLAEDLDKDSFKAISWISSDEYNPSFSYRKYTMKVKDIIHFAYDSDTNNYYPYMDTDYANNVTGYQNLKYGLYWQEPSGKKWPGDFSETGEIVIIDNDRPNIFVKMKDLKYDDFEYVAPGRLKAEAWGEWKNLFGDVTNGPQLLSGVIGGIENSFKFLALDEVKTEFYRTDADETSKLEVDVPAFFEVVAFDNCGIVEIDEFSALKDGEAMGDEEFFVTNAEQKYLFREPGTYKITVSCKDNALGWPTDPTKPIATAGNSKNHRDMEIDLEVLNTRLDIRIIERQRDDN